MGALLSRPLTSKVIQRYGRGDLIAASCEMQGRRANMQDSLRVILDFTQDSSFFGIFDGHGDQGDWASRFFAENLPGSLQGKQLTMESIIETCLEVDKAFVTASRKEKKDFSDSGTTAVFCVLQKQVEEQSDAPKNTYKIIVGNIGDSRCVLIRNGNEEKDLVHLTVDHKPNNDKELHRINNAGGFVSMGRVEGLAISRAFGDFNLKRNENFSPDQQKVICVPDIVEIDGIGENDTLLLMCDGVYERSDTENVVQIIKNFMKHAPEDPGKVLQHLFDDRVTTSEDNMSAILIQFKDGTAYIENKTEFIHCEVTKYDDNAFQAACEAFAKKHGYNVAKRKKSKDESGKRKHKKKKKTTEEVKPSESETKEKSALNNL